MKNKNANRLIILLSGILLLACSIPIGRQDSTVPPQDTQTSAGQATATEEPIASPTHTHEPNETLNAPEESLPVGVPQPQEGDTLSWLDGSLLVYIPPGEFIMGLGSDDNPEHEVYLDGFWIYRTEVTNSMYLRCIAIGECSPPAVDPALPDLENPDLADFPVVGVRWDQAENYCNFVGGTLPTEAQWEKTARGPDGNIYPWGHNKPGCERLNFNDCLGEISAVLDYPQGASPYGVLDMAGNIFEWVADWYQEDYYADSPADNSMGPEFGEVRSIRGSTFRTKPDQIEPSLRYFLEPDEYRLDLGFRCVVGFAHEFAPPCEVLAYIPPDTVAENPESPPGGSASCIVSQPEISVITYCNNGTRGNNISWTPADADVNYSSSAGVSCSMYDADTLACGGIPDATVEIEVCKSCPPPVVQLGKFAKCDPPYVLNVSAGLCEYDGPPVPGKEFCTPGHSLNAAGTCCEIQEGSPLDFPICPVGGIFEPTSNICWFLLPSTGDKKCDNLTVYFDYCPPPPGGGHPEVDPCAKYSFNECQQHQDQCFWDIDTIPEGCRSRPD
jgi:formylglycine-generating enzyme required for sulfatase activity